MTKSECFHPPWYVGIAIGSLDALRNDLNDPTMRLRPVIDLCAQCRPYANILASQTRRADQYGPALQAIHIHVGRYVAQALLDAVPPFTIGTDDDEDDDDEYDSDNLARKVDFPHVQGNTFGGWDTAPSLKECNVTIVAMMRCGEPMARGVYECFPCAQFVHYHDDHPACLDVACCCTPHSPTPTGTEKRIGNGNG